jgi:WD40 repeat protein
MDWSPDGKRVAVIGSPGLILFPETLEKMIGSSAHGFVFVAWHPDKDLIAAGDGTSVIVLDGTTLAEETRIFVNDNRIIKWSPNGQLLAISSKEKVEIWEISSQPSSSLSLQKTRTLAGHLAWIKSISWSPDS